MSPEQRVDCCITLCVLRSKVKSRDVDTEGGGEGTVHEVAFKSPSGVDGDDLTSTSAHQKDPVETLSQNLKELHVCETVTVKECSFQT